MDVLIKGFWVLWASTSRPSRHPPPRTPQTCGRGSEEEVERPQTGARQGGRKAARKTDGDHPVANGMIAEQCPHGGGGRLPSVRHSAVLRPATSRARYPRLAPSASAYRPAADVIVLSAFDGIGAAL